MHVKAGTTFITVCIIRTEVHVHQLCNKIIKLSNRHTLHLKPVRGENNFMFVFYDNMQLRVQYFIMSSRQRHGVYKRKYYFHI